MTPADVRATEVETRAAEAAIPDQPDPATLQARVERLETELAWMRQTLSWRWTEPVRQAMGMLARLVRVGQFPRRAGGVSAKPSPRAAKQAQTPTAVPPHVSEGNKAYASWSQQNDPRAADLARMRSTARLLPRRPLISVLMPVYDPPERFLREAVESVLAQAYEHWELCIADDASTLPHVRPLLESFAAWDARIKLHFRTENGHISRCSNDALALANGEFVALLDHDDRLAPHALYEVALLLNQHPDADVVYSDEDKIDAENRRRDPYFKPQWSPDTLLSRMYVGHLGVYRRSLLADIGGFRAGFEGSQDYDLALRATERAESVYHIPAMLYHWRSHSNSAAAGADVKPYAYAAAQRALSDALARRGEPGTIEQLPGTRGFYRIRYRLSDRPKVSIIIPTRDQPALLQQCLASVFGRSSWRDFEVVVVDNGSVDPQALAVIDYWAGREPERLRVLRLDVPFNFSLLNNRAVAASDGDMLLFLNDDTEVTTPDWLEALLEQAQRPGIGAVGPLLFYPSGRVQHAGVMLGLGGVAGHAHQGEDPCTAGYFGRVIAVTNVAAVTAACLMCRREVFEQVGGFDESLPVAFNDVDLCLRFLDAGLRNVYTPHARLIHRESESRGYDHADPAKLERLLSAGERMRARWGSLIVDDPYYSPHLTRHGEDCAIRTADK
ncbi:glycosyltransferase family 2 protein [uncultured Thiohalocapsa sp.]|uniref:glycosyltransferase family 2 protein n=1 Tax=uncultured Thiohalocapsa sp. TaxID=768990 RepID=UPI0025E0E9CD|nr:glycosyltransferase family 2 protein [uncultured Thiohalocapsa sp.]